MDDLEEDPEEDLEEEPAAADTAGPEPLFCFAETFISNGTEGGDTAAYLRKLLTHLRYDKAPEYHVKKARKPGRTEWHATVFLHDHGKLINSNTGLCYCFTRAEAVADAAWEAVTVICHGYRRYLDDSEHEYVPRRLSGKGVLYGAGVRPSLTQGATEDVQRLLLDMGRRYESALGELKKSFLRTQRLEAELKRRQKAQGGSVSTGSDEPTWTATSPRRKPEQCKPQAPRHGGPPLQGPADDEAASRA